MWNMNAVNWNMERKADRDYPTLEDALVAASVVDPTFNVVAAMRCITATDGYTGLYRDTFITVRRVLSKN